MKDVLKNYLFHKPTNNKKRRCTYITLYDNEEFCSRNIGHISEQYFGSEEIWAKLEKNAGFELDNTRHFAMTWNENKGDDICNDG